MLKPVREFTPEALRALGLLRLAGERPGARERRRAGGDPLRRRGDRPGGPRRAGGERAAAVGGEKPGTGSLEEIERDHILRVLRETGGNQSRASQLLGIDRKTLYLKLRKYGLPESPA